MYSWKDNYENLVNKYWCKYTSNASCSSDYYILSADSSYSYNIELKDADMSVDKYLYLIRNTENSSYKKEILVIDWKGNPFQLLQSYENITNIVISEKEKRAYCLVLEPEFQLKYFDL